MITQHKTPAASEQQLESACVELSSCLRAGSPCRAEELFASNPVLFAKADTAMEVIYTEFVTRLQLGDKLEFTDWYARFPRWENELRRLFEVHEVLCSTTREDAAESALSVSSDSLAEVVTGSELHKFAQYELLGKVGKGAMGVVYKARQSAPLRRIVALKTVRAGSLANAAAVRRFYQEAQLAGGLRHAHIMPIYEVGQHDGQPYFTMPLVPGGSVAGQLERFAGKPRAVATLVEKVARAVHHAHRHGILHRDLKPANILLDDQDEPLVTDFGLAKFQQLEPAVPKEAHIGSAEVLSHGEMPESSCIETEAGQVVGTPAYLPPEQTVGQSHEVSVASDIWALGVILYELLTGRHPFSAPTRELLYQQIRTAEPPVLRALRSGVPRDLEAICMKCLQKNPEARYASAGALAADLRRYLTDYPVHARRVGPPERTRKWAKRHPVGAVLAAACVLTVSGLLASIELMNQRIRTARTGDLINALLAADISRVPDIADELRRTGAVAEPQLREVLVSKPADSPERVRAALVLLPADDRQFDFLYERLLTASPDEVKVLREALQDRGQALTVRLWRVLEDKDVNANQGIRAACALASSDPDSPRWTKVRRNLLSWLVAENQYVLAQWARLLRPVAPQVLPVIAEEIQTALPGRFTSLVLLLQVDREAAARLLDRELDKVMAMSQAAPANEKLDRRQSLLAVALLQLGQPDRIWPMFRHSANPQRRTYLIHDLALLGTNPERLIQRFEEEPDTTARRALLLCLGEFPPEAISARLNEQLRRRLASAYRNDSDAGVHSAVDWLWRTWNLGGELKAIDQDLMVIKHQPGFQWYMTREGNVLALVPEPTEIEMSPPFDDQMLYLTDVPRRYRPRPFAIGTKEITVEQFRRFDPQYVYDKRRAPEPDCPANRVNFHAAARYCNWLSQREGIPGDQWCYVPVLGARHGEMDPHPDILSRAGYRLPMTEEWEYASRAGATTIRFFGKSEEHLPKYAWYLNNSAGRTWPVGLLKPNDLGLFDIYGNVTEWAMFLDRKGDELRQEVRGYSAIYPGQYLGAGKKDRASMYWTNDTVGFRIARSLVPTN